MEAEVTILIIKIWDFLKGKSVKKMFCLLKVNIFYGKIGHKY